MATKWYCSFEGPRLTTPSEGLESGTFWRNENGVPLRMRADEGRPLSELMEVFSIGRRFIHVFENDDGSFTRQECSEADYRALARRGARAPQRTA
ncbi:MAG: hypothetical protein L0206_16925 [Actinobacteria bacterium]|nr:hypothetical protein [Actinomycetota bacterium]